MKKMSKNQKLAVYGAGGVLLLYLLYRYYQSKNTAAATNPVDQSGAATPSDLATQAGQEQSDVAALQNEIAGLQGSLSGAPTQTDITGLQSAIATLQGDVTGLMSGQQAPPAGGTNSGGVTAVTSPNPPDSNTAGATAAALGTVLPVASPGWEWVGQYVGPGFVSSAAPAGWPLPAPGWEYVGKYIGNAVTTATAAVQNVVPAGGGGKISGQQPGTHRHPPTQHQATQSGHNGSHASGGVAPTDHNPKRK